MILDKYGKEYRKPPAALPQSPWLRSRDSRHDPRTITLDDLAVAFRAANTGDLAAQGELWTAIEEMDGHVNGDSAKLAESINNLRPQLSPADDSAQQREISEFLRIHLLEHPQWAELQTVLGYTPLTGVQAAETVWEQSAGQAVPHQFRRLSHGWLTYRNHVGHLQDSPLIVTDAAPLGVVPAPWQIVCHEHKPLLKHPARSGAWRSVSRMTVLKLFGMQDFWMFSERCGLPYVVGKYPQHSQAESIAELWQAVQAVTADGRAVMEEGASIEFHNILSAAGSGALWDVQIRVCNAEISKAILGQTLSTESSGSGSYALGITHENLRHEQVLRVARAIAATLTAQLIKPIVLFNFGSAAKVPQLQYVAPKMAGETEAKFLAEATKLVPVPSYYIYDVLGIPHPEAGDAVVHNPPLPPMTLASQPTGGQQIKQAKNAGQKDIAPLRKPAPDAIKEMDDNTRLMTQAVTGAGSYEEALNNISALLPRIKSSIIQETLEQRIFAAQMRGRQYVQDKRPK